MQCITTFFGRAKDLSPGQRADRVIASGIRVPGALSNTMKPVFRWPHICEMAKAMGHHHLHLSGVDRKQDVILLANSVIKPQAIHVGCQAWVIMNAADNLEENVLRSEMLLAEAKRSCQRTPPHGHCAGLRSAVARRHKKSHDLVEVDASPAPMHPK